MLGANDLVANLRVMPLGAPAANIKEIKDD
jgi:hypothetical protein